NLFLTQLYYDWANCSTIRFLCSSNHKEERSMTVTLTSAIPDIFFLPEWGKAYESQDHGENCIFEFRNGKGHVFYQFIKRPIPIDAGGMQFYDTITPFGQSGPLIVECEKGKEKELADAFDGAFQVY